MRRIIRPIKVVGILAALIIAVPLVSLTLKLSKAIKSAFKGDKTEKGLFNIDYINFAKADVPNGGGNGGNGGGDVFPEEPEPDPDCGHDGGGY